MTKAEGRRLIGRIRAIALRRGIAAARAAASGSGESLYLVGGCVRDLLLDRPLRDLDLVVEGDPAALAREAARRLGGRTHGPSPFGTCRIDTPGGLRIDVAMSRRETYSAPAELPRVEAAPIEEDLRRRDFTVNSLALLLTGPERGLLIDPDRGLRDLSSRVLRLHHGRSLVDDPTRAYRGARYAARCGFRMASGWSSAIETAGRSRAFARLSPARLRHELELAWTEPDPVAALGKAARWGLLRHVDRSLSWTPALRRSLRRASPEPGRDPLLFFTLLTGSVPARARGRMLARLGLEGGKSRAILSAAEALRRADAILKGSSDDVRAMERAAAWDALSVAALGALSPREAKRIGELRRRWEAAAPLLDGSRMEALGVPRGPRIGSILLSLRRARAGGRIRTEAEEAAFVRRHALRPRRAP